MAMADATSASLVGVAAVLDGYLVGVGQR